MKIAQTAVPDMPRRPVLQQQAPGTIAVFRALQLGDMLCAIPALRALRAAASQARITLIGLPWAQQLVSRFNRYIDDFVAFPGHPAFPEQPLQAELVPAFYEAMRARNFDLAVQMHGSGQISNQIVAAFGAKAMAGYAVTANAEVAQAYFIDYPQSGAEPIGLLGLTKFLGAPDVGTDLEFPLGPDDEQELRESGLDTGLVAGSYLCIHPGARSRDKCWPPQRFAEVADRLADEFGLAVVLTGSAKEADLTAAVAAHMRNKAHDTAAPLSIGAMALLMSRARLLVCNDTGVSHIAAGLKLPSIVISATPTSNAGLRLTRPCTAAFAIHKENKRQRHCNRHARFSTNRAIPISA